MAVQTGQVGWQHTTLNRCCTNCGEAMTAVNEGSHPTDRVPGDETAKVFCNSACKETWQKEHCAWCGVSPITGTLTVAVVGQPPEMGFCDVAHRQAYNDWQPAAAISAAKQG